jgi:hypothetical protein
VIRKSEMQTARPPRAKPGEKIHSFHPVTLFRKQTTKFNPARLAVLHAGCRQSIQAARACRISKKALINSSSRGAERRGDPEMPA